MFWSAKNSAIHQDYVSYHLCLNPTHNIPGKERSVLEEPCPRNFKMNLTTQILTITYSYFVEVDPLKLLSLLLLHLPRRLFDPIRQKETINLQRNYSKKIYTESDQTIFTEYITESAKTVLVELLIRWKITMLWMACNGFL